MKKVIVLLCMVVMLVPIVSNAYWYEQNRGDESANGSRARWQDSPSGSGGSQYIGIVRARPNVVVVTCAEYCARSTVTSLGYSTCMERCR